MHPLLSVASQPNLNPSAILFYGQAVQIVIISGGTLRAPAMGVIGRIDYGPMSHSRMARSAPQHALRSSGTCHPGEQGSQPSC